MYCMVSLATGISIKRDVTGTVSRQNDDIDVKMMLWPGRHNIDPNPGKKKHTQALPFRISVLIKADRKMNTSVCLLTAEI